MPWKEKKITSPISYPLKGCKSKDGLPGRHKNFKLLFFPSLSILWTETREYYIVIGDETTRRQASPVDPFVDTALQQLPCRKGTKCSSCSPSNGARVHDFSCSMPAERKAVIITRYLRRTSDQRNRVETNTRARCARTDSAAHPYTSAIRAAPSSKATQAATSRDAAAAQQADTDTVAAAATRRQTAPLAARRGERAASAQRRRTARASTAMRCSTSLKARMMRRSPALWARSER